MSKLDRYLRKFGVDLMPKNKPTQGRLATQEENEEQEAETL